MPTTPSLPVFRGAFTALTPLFRHDAVDEPALRRLVDIQIESGIHGLVPCGTTGESVTMTDDDQDRVIGIVIDQTAGRVPVIVGTGTINTRTAIDRTRRARLAGADAALVVVPYYNKPSQEGLHRHYESIASAADLPILLYNVPGRTGVNMTSETIPRRSAVTNPAGLKEASSNLDQVSEIVIAAWPDFAVLSGGNSLTLPIMSVGGHGVMSVVSNIAPTPVAELAAACLRGDIEEARPIHARLFDLCRAMFIESNPTAVKTSANLLGLCADDVRLPLTAVSDGSRRRIVHALQVSGLIEATAA